MASKTANVLARVEPEVKSEAEAIMAQLGVPVSVVINMLYRQIIMTRSIPFPTSVPKVKVPKALDEMTEEEFKEMMRLGMEDARAGRVKPLDEVFDRIIGELSEHGDL